MYLSFYSNLFKINQHNDYFVLLAIYFSHQIKHAASGIETLKSMVHFKQNFFFTIDVISQNIVIKMFIRVRTLQTVCYCVTVTVLNFIVQGVYCYHIG